jgi:hypothetical protein
MMTSIPDHPKEQLLFFFDNPLLAAEPGGNKLIAAYLELVAPLIGLPGHGQGSSSMAGAFEPGAAFAPQGSSGDSGGGGGGHHGKDGHADPALVTMLGLVGGLARGDLDL